MEKDRHDVKVVIIGAGMAGLGTAHHLLQAGFPSITLLEASDRVGGRIRSVRVCEEVMVELGATCIHGASPDNPVFSMATDFGLTSSLVHLDKISGQYYQENGETIDKSLVAEVWKLYMDMETDMAGTFLSGNLEEALQNRTTVAEFTQKARVQILQHFAEGQRRQTADRALNTMFSYLQFMNGDRNDKVSADLFGQYKTFSGPDMMFTGKGYSGLVEKLQEQIPAEAIQLNREVTKIRWGGNQVEIICKGDKKYSADHVVVTCSLGHLKANHQHLFEPSLPDPKAEAIQRRGFGRVTKLFLYYDQPVIADGIKLVWSKYGDPITDRSQWFRDITWLCMLPTNSKTIGGPFAGDGAEIIESLSDEDVAVQCTQLLRQFLQDPTFPQPTRVLRSHWNTDPLYRGGYSYPSQESQVDDVHHLAAPLPSTDQPKLLFAGEATHPDYYSTVHGAYLSGMRESQRLADFYTR